ncbi:hypothetical protein OF83DRAFT_377527 [Amylostereum chailletii]|nr:hypothetical protein OF83DRAFT_377527 [Amylostereum chailletii]
MDESLQKSDDEHDELDPEYYEDDAEAPINDKVFSIRNALEIPGGFLMTTRELHDEIHQGLIDLDPPYQRDVVWTTAKQMEIIDSIFHNCYVPPIVFSVMPDPETGESIRMCVDGKQRLTSIQRFFDGHIAYRDPDTRKLWYYTTSPSNKNTRNEIPPVWKETFAQKLLTVVEYTDLSDVNERDVFQRVQLGMSLTWPERMQAIVSPRANWIHDLEQRYVSVNNGLSDFANFDSKRGRDFQNVAHIIFCCESLPSHPTPAAKVMEKWLKRPDELAAGFKKAVKDTMQAMAYMAASDNLNKGFTKIQAKVSPAEFVFIGVFLSHWVQGRSLVLMGRVGVLLYRMGTDYTYEEKADAVLYLRRRVREQFKDVRLNSSVCKFLWEVVDNLVDGEADAVVERAERKKATKRKRAQDDDDETDDERPSSSGTKSRCCWMKVGLRVFTVLFSVCYRTCFPCVLGRGARMSTQ